MIIPAKEYQGFDSINDAIKIYPVSEKDVFGIFKINNEKFIINPKSPIKESGASGGVEEIKRNNPGKNIYNVKDDTYFKIPLVILILMILLLKIAETNKRGY